jgi:23S rRNA (cytidine2498-2'-O)-methyltransferase
VSTCPTTLIITCAAGREGDARRELREALGEIDARSLFLKGNLIARTPLPEEDAVSRLREAPTRLIARATPVQAEVAITAAPESLERLAAAALRLGRLPRRATFYVQCRRRGDHQFRSRDVQRAVGMALEQRADGIPEFVVVPAYTVSVEIFQDRAYIGLNPTAQLVHKELRDARKWRPGERPLNRAQLKLREALATFGIELRPGMRALDLGAAPGGWTLVLAEAGCQVVAVDKGELDAEPAQRPQVQHLRMSAQEALQQDLGDFDIIVNDMNLESAESAEIMCAFAERLRPGGRAVMTIKFVTSARRRHEREATERLSRCYTDIAVRHLPHNRGEATAVMRRPPASGRSSWGPANAHRAHSCGLHARGDAVRAGDTGGGDRARADD